ncbi:tetratricopeptide repeat protein [Tahibacter sp. UC22_41]|uniref:tetratricopeptide repeat protein n=1 Tax=Tahibacter sp. UC22_41 TaxID=3350178 RepID=UPI0036DFA0FA
MPEQRLTLEQIVQRAGDRLATQTDLSAPTRIDLLRLLAEVSMAASDFPQAQRLLDQAMEAGRTTWAANDVARRRIRLLQAQLLILQTRYADAADAYEALLPQLRDATDEAAIRGLQNYARALMYSARSEKALAISAEATQAAAGVYGAESQGTALAALEHAGILLGAGQTTEAVAAYEPALQRWRDRAWAPSPEFLQGLIRLSRARLDLGDTQAAERLARENLTAVERLYQPPHEQIARALLNLGEVLIAQERLDDAEPALSRALAMYRTIYGEGEMRDVNTSARIGLLQWRRRDLEAAAQTIVQAWRWCTRPGLHATRTCIELDTEQARIALARGELAAVEISSTRGLTMAREIYRDGGGAVAELLQLRAGAQLAGGDAAAALRSCDEALSRLQATGEAEGPVAVEVLARRAAALEAVQRIADARTDVEHALRLSARMAPEGYRRQVELLAQRARLQAAAGDAAAARATAQSARALIRRREEIDPAALAVLQRY